jgi:hypothetical protein
MNGFESSARPSSERERERDLQHASDFHAVLLGMAAHDLRQMVTTINRLQASRWHFVLKNGRASMGEA